MACEANCIHDPGHEYNMEGPLRFPLPYGPISVRNVGKGTEVENGRKCSRLLYGAGDADQLCESDRGVADDIDPVYGQLCESRYGDDVGPARGELYGYGDPMDVRIYMVDVELGVARGYHESQAGLASNDDGITHERQGNPASNDVFPRGFGNVSESQAVPASSYTVESLENAVQLQNRQMVESATVTCQKLKFAITGANEMLLSLNEQRSVIPQDLVMDLETHLATSIRWLYDQVQEQDKATKRLLNVKQSLENKIGDLLKDKSNLEKQLAKAPPKSSQALSAIELRKLELLGINNVTDLINQFRSLQVQVSEMKADKSRNALSVSTRKDTVAQPEKVVQIPKIIKPQGGTCFSKIGDQHEGENNKVDEKREVYRGLGNAKIPQPPLCKGKSRADLERFFRYFEPYADSLSLDNSAKALLVGYYIPSLQYQHDSLMQRKACYSEVKRELLNSLGSDSSVTTYSLRAHLDKLIKPVTKSYRSFLEKVERKVAEAFGSDKSQREQELKKILLRLTQEDPDTSYCSTTLPHIAAGYYRLKELVLGIEDANKMRKQNKHLVEHGSPDKSFSLIDSSQCDLAAEYQDYNTVQQKQAEVGEHQQRCPALERQAFENVDRIQAVNVSHKRSSVAFIGYKPKRTRDFKGSPKRSYASVAAAKSSVDAASRSGPSTKAIKHCFVCGEVLHLAKDCPVRFVEKGMVGKVTQKYTVGGISFEYADAKDKSHANLELDALPFSACYTVGNDTVKAHVVDVPATKKEKDLSENDSMMPLVNDDAQRRDILNCIRVNQIEIVRDNVVLSQVKPYVKQKEPLSTVVITDSSIRQRPRQSGKELKTFCNSSADHFQSAVTSILHQHQLNSQLKDISLNKVLQLESSKSDVLFKYGKQSRPIYDLIL